MAHYSTHSMVSLFFSTLSGLFFFTSLMLSLQHEAHPEGQTNKSKVPPQQKMLLIRMIRSSGLFSAHCFKDSGVTLGIKQWYACILYMQCGCMCVCISKTPPEHKTYHSAAGCAASEEVLTFILFASHYKENILECCFFVTHTQ